MTSRSISDKAIEQQVNVQASLILSLPLCWVRPRIERHIRDRLAMAFLADLPPDDGGTPVLLFSFQEETEIYRNVEGGTNA